MNPTQKWTLDKGALITRERIGQPLNSSKDNQLSILFFNYFFKIYFIYLFLAVLGLCCCAWAFSSCGEQGYSLLPCAGFSLQWLLLLQSTGSRCVGFSRCGTQASVVVACGLQSAGSVVVARGLGSFCYRVVLQCAVCGLLVVACGIQFPDQGSNLGPLHWEHRVLTTGPPRKSLIVVLICISLMTLNISLRAYRSSVYFWKNVCSSLLPVFQLGCLLLVSCRSSLYILDTCSLSDISFGNISSRYSLTFQMVSFEYRHLKF